jgi:gas vesicle protein
MSSGKLLLGVAAGVAAGALLGILFAPEKGSVIRRKISKKGEDYVDSIKGKINEVVEKIFSKIEEVSEEVENAKPGKVK